MTPRKYERENPPGIEHVIDGIGRQVSDLVRTVHGMYDKVGEVLGRSNSIYDMLAHERETSSYSPDCDFLDEDEA